MMVMRVGIVDVGANTLRLLVAAPDGAGGVAFNLADVAVAAGFVLLLPVTALFGLKNRERLFDPV